MALLVAEYAKILGANKYNAAVEETLTIVPPLPPWSTRMSSNAL